jgi:hypothetical protein
MPAAVVSSLVAIEPDPVTSMVLAGTPVSVTALPVVLVLA